MIDERPQRIAFVACTKNAQKYPQDPAFIYRCENPALALKQQGHKVELMHYSALLQRSEHFDRVIFHRPSMRTLLDTFVFPRLIKRLKKQGTRLIADFDDLVFDPNKAAVSPGVINGVVSLKQVKKNFRQHQRCIEFFDAITVSTEPLLNKVQILHTDIPSYWLPNSPHFSWYQKQPPASPEHLTLAYFPGTRSHDKDFSLIYDPLAQFLSEVPTARLSITGVLETSHLKKQLKCQKHQLSVEPKVPYKDYWQAVANSSVNLAPLENTEFNCHKSALKAIEAGYWNIPTIASPIPDMKRYEKAGALLAETTEDWYRQLHYANKQVEKSPVLREQVLKVARIENVSQQLLTIANND